jgi:aminoglycoside phosphotransferase (APT) family kinase protein
MTDSEFGVHGYLKDNLESLFRRTLDIPDLSIMHSLGGMSNINLAAQSEEGVLVLRIPALMIGYSLDYYRQEFLVSADMFRNDLGPRPLAYGALDDEKHTPFMAYHFEPGVVHQKIETMSQEEIDRLQTALEGFQNLEVSGATRYETAEDYLHYLHKRAVSFSSGTEPLSGKMKRAMRSLDETLQQMEPALEELDWREDSMHGDLRPSNMIFQEKRVIFIDWSEYCMGDPLFDVAYLFSEPIELISSDVLTQLASRDEDQMLAYIGLALFSSISWTVERLIRCELGQVSPSLSSKEIVHSMESYVNLKTDQLNQILQRI